MCHDARHEQLAQPIASELFDHNYIARLGIRGSNRKSKARNQNALQTNTLGVCLRPAQVDCLSSGFVVHAVGEDLGIAKDEKAAGEHFGMPF
jgi:hypothetical protein